ncbi:pyridoxal-phosphate dependent enzyme [Rhodobacteraceae bacterium CCMM004]|nr:pyridoxal-phosphate dependent enzyme [Rhodobacteraceae bacterium CCMM004]
MEHLTNPHRGTGLSGLDDIPWPLADAGPPQALVARCPRHAPTPLAAAPGLAAAAGVADLRVKDERGRMGLGSFKALGAAHVIARDAAEGQARGRTYVTASAGNHGMSVAAGAAAFGAHARVWIAETVPESFADRLRAEGAEVVREGATYEDSMAAGERAATREGQDLLSDSSWPGYVDRPLHVMEGYLILMAEVVAVMPAPTHVFVQAGVGGLAAAVAAHVRSAWDDGPRVVVVEPAAAACLTESVRAGRPVTAPGPVSSMGRLDCKDASLIALKGLARDADAFVTIGEDEAAEGVARAAAEGLASTPSGAAGIAALLASGPHRTALGLDGDARVLAFLTERAEG